MRSLSTIDNRPSTLKARRPAFTLVELLVVIGIIAVLASILFPVIGKVREAARETDTRAFITSIESACQTYKQDFNAYPGPLSSSELTALNQSNGRPVYPATGGTAINGGAVTPAGVVTGPRITEAENLVLGLMGGLAVDRTVTPNLLRFDPALIGNGPTNLNPNRPGRANKYMEVANLSTGIFTTADGTNTQAKDSIIPEYLDRWPEGLPILVLRARVGGRGESTTTYSATNNDVVVNTPFDPANPSNGASVGQYNLVEITPYTQANIGVHLKDSDYKPTARSSGDPYHGLVSVDVAKSTDKNNANYAYPYDAFSYLTDPSTYDSTKSTYSQADLKKMKARKVDQIILISAGRDRVYGTSDDLTNFGSVLP